MSTSEWVKSLLGHTPEELRLVVLSDIHVYHDEATLLGHSNYARDMSDHSISNNPVAALKELIESRGIRADFLICPGDITDRAHPGALEHGWRLLHEIKDLVGAKAVLATPGNHDLDSRYAHTKYDAKGVAVNLSPDFPISDRQLADTFWARNFVLLEGGNYRIVLLNSAAYHGEGTVFPGDPSDKTPRPPPLPEYEHGRISPNTLDAIEKLLKATDPKPVNILVCHHHPDRLSGARFESDYSAMQGGRELTDTLARPEYGRWVIIHGHKHLGAVHQPSCSTSPGPIAFCAGSFGKTLPRDWPSGNQIYELQVSTDPRSYGLGIAARFLAYEWIRGGNGWEIATPTSNLPGTGGFGYLGDPAALAAKVDAVMKESDANEMTLDELARRATDLRFLPPTARETLRHELRTLNIRLIADPDDGETLFRRRQA